MKLKINAAQAKAIVWVLAHDGDRLPPSLIPDEVNEELDELREMGLVEFFSPLPTGEVGYWLTRKGERRAILIREVTRQIAARESVIKEVTA